MLRIMPYSNKALVKEQVAVNVGAEHGLMVAVDETRIEAGGILCYLWAPIKVDRHELLALWVSCRGTSLMQRFS